MKSFEGYLDTDEGDLELKFVVLEGGIQLLSEDLEQARKICDETMIGINALREQLAIDVIDED